MGSPPRPGGRDREITAPCVLRFGLGGLRQVREVTARWAARAGLVPERAGDFVIAVNEIATNAVRYGSPAVQLVLRVTGVDMAQAEVRDQGRWPPGSTAAAAGEERGGMGPAPAQPGPAGAAVTAGRDPAGVVRRPHGAIHGRARTATAGELMPTFQPLARL